MKAGVQCRALAGPRDWLLPWGPAATLTRLPRQNRGARSHCPGGRSDWREGGGGGSSVALRVASNYRLSGKGARHAGRGAARRSKAQHGAARRFAGQRGGVTIARGRGVVVFLAGSRLERETIEGRRVFHTARVVSQLGQGSREHTACCCILRLPRATQTRVRWIQCSDLGSDT